MSCVIIGAGGHGRVVLDILKRQGVYRAIGFLDTDESLHGRMTDGVKVLGPLAHMKQLQSEGVSKAVVAIGDNGVRRAFMDEMSRLGVELISAVHPSANIAGNASLGNGVVVAAGALVGAHCQIGDGVILNTGCIVDHETMIGTACHICPGVRIAGRVTVESGAFIGIGATVIQRIRIGHDAVVGAGAVVLEDVQPLSTVVGMPAKPVRPPCHLSD